MERSTLKELLNWGAKHLSKHSPSSVLDSEVLLSHVLHREKTYLYSNPDKKLSPIQYSRFQNLVLKRAHEWPVAYLIGHKEFCGLDFKVTSDVLIPRPETESLVELAIRRIKNQKSRIKNVIDIGTGSGNLIISLAKKLAEYNRLVYYTTRFYSIDSSTKALKIAKSNARRHGLANKIKFLQSNLLENCRLKIESSLVVANLPYLTPSQYSSNPNLKYEPRSALVGGKGGLKYLIKLFIHLSKFEIRHPTFFFEHDPSQKEKLKTLARKYFPQAKVNCHKDFAGKHRVMEISTNP